MCTINQKESVLEAELGNKQVETEDITLPILQPSDTLTCPVCESHMHYHVDEHNRQYWSCSAECKADEKHKK